MKFLRIRCRGKSTVSAGKHGGARPRAGRQRGFVLLPMLGLIAAALLLGAAMLRIAVLGQKAARAAANRELAVQSAQAGMLLAERELEALLTSAAAGIAGATASAGMNPSVPPGSVGTSGSDPGTGAAAPDPVSALFPAVAGSCNVGGLCRPAAAGARPVWTLLGGSDAAGAVIEIITLPPTPAGPNRSARLFFRVTVAGRAATSTVLLQGVYQVHSPAASPNGRVLSPRLAWRELSDWRERL